VRAPAAAGSDVARRRLLAVDRRPNPTSIVVPRGISDRGYFARKVSTLAAKFVSG
jgi:hypothetical protein